MKIILTKAFLSLRVSIFVLKYQMSPSDFIYSFILIDSRQTLIEHWALKLHFLCAVS